MLVPFSFTVPYIDTAIRFYDHARIFKSTTQTGTFTEVSTPATRVSLEAGVISYMFPDLAGDPDAWYQFQLANSRTGAVGTASPAVLGVDPALDVLTVQELKSTMLFGVDLTDDHGNPFPESLFEFYIKSAVTYLENAIGVAMRPRSIADEQHDFHKQEFIKFVFVQTDYVPIRAVASVKLVLPQNEVLTEFPTTWHVVDAPSGQIQLLPAQGQASLILLGQGSVWLPLIYGNFDWVPGLIRVTYTAGWERGQVPADLKMAVALLASIGPMNIAGDLVIGPGTQGTAMTLDGIHQSISTTASAENTAFGAQIRTRVQQLKEMVPVLRLAYRGVGLLAA